MTDAPLHDLHSFVAQASEKMASDYRRISAKAKEDPGTAGDQGEANWRALLEDWLPKGYSVETKGRLINTKGEMSRQVDVVVLKPSYPKRLLQEKIWLADGVAAVFECKTTLTAADVEDAIEKCASAKALFDKRVGTLRKELRSPLVFGLLAHSHSWKAQGSKPVKNIERAIGVAQPKVAHPRLEIDIICVADLTVWVSYFLCSFPPRPTSGDIAELRKFVQGEKEIYTALSRALTDPNQQSREFQPIGTLIAALYQKLAWDDATLRGIADYFRLAKLWGAGIAKPKRWGLEVLSDNTSAGDIVAYDPGNQPWNEWARVSW